MALESLQHIAMEGRCFVLGAGQYIIREQFGQNWREIIGDKPTDPVMRGASVIVGPLGEVIAGPVYDEKAILVAVLDREILIKSKLDFDPVDHCASPDVFSIKVDREAKLAVQ